MDVLLRVDDRSKAYLPVEQSLPQSLIGEAIIQCQDGMQQIGGTHQRVGKGIVHTQVG